MVHFVGAGPGAPDLITLRGAALLETADTVIYAGSLVNPALLARCKDGCEVHNSATMTLDEVLAVMERAAGAGKSVVRLHTGDPSLYGAVREQMDALSEQGIDYDVTPGVSSLFGAAAALGAEFTLPGVSQSLIVTRLAGRTGVPERERLRELARHGASMAIFLSAGLLGGVRSELLAGGLPADTPAAVVYKATWPEEKIVRCTVGTLAEAGAEIRRTALIFVGRFLDAPYEKSRLYDPAFTTGCRRGSGGGEIAYLSFTERGRALAERLRTALGGEAACTRDGVRLRDWTAAHFPTARALVYVGAAGIAVRAVAEHLASKLNDPAVIAADEGGRFVIPLASGHLGGANELAREIARVTGGVAAVTTATDVNGVFAVDEWARVQGCAVAGAAHIREVSGKLLAGETITVRSAFPIRGEPPSGVALTDAPDVWVDIRPHEGLTVVPRVLTLGVGCRRGTPREMLEARLAALCAAAHILPEAISEAASIDWKADEPGLLAFCAAHGWPLRTYTAAELSATPGEFTASAFVEKTTGVDNVCERAAVRASGGTLLARKFAGDGVTLALAQREASLDWRWQNG